MKLFLKRTQLYLLVCLVSLLSLAGKISGAQFSDSLNPGSDSARFITWSYKETPMGLYVPASTGKKIPIVMFLHSCHNELVVPELWIISALNTVEPCAVFIPTAPPAIDFTCADWGGTYDGSRRPNMVNALHELDSIIKVFGFDTTRIYLYGESMGGEGVYRLLADFPSRFAGGVTAAGYTVNKSADKMAKTPLWIFHSAEDEISGVDNARTIHQAILSAGGTTVHYTEYEDLSHSSSIQKARTEEGLLKWLLTQIRSEFAEPDTGKDSTKFITWTYKDANMGLYLPKSTGKPLPVVMYLHYCTGNPVYPEFWIIPALNAVEPCAVFVPTAPPELNTQNSCADWGGTYDAALRPNMINALHELDSIIKLHGFDTSRQYIYGESMGGEGVYRLLMDFPTRFAGGVVASGYTANKGADKMAKTPLWIFHGSDDNTSSVDNARTIHQSILNAGGTEVKYTEYEGLDHVPAMNQPHEEDGLMEWLLSQKHTTTILKQPRKQDAIRKTDLLYCKNGSLYFSRPVPSDAFLSLFGLNGETIYETAMSVSTVVLPLAFRNRVMLWRVSNKSFSTSGKIMPIAK